MAEYFIVYSASAGTELWRGQCQDGQADRQVLPEGAALLKVSAAAMGTVPVDLDIIRDDQRAIVDAAADTFCLQFVTPGVTQSMRYQEKLAEAKAWTTGADPTHFPFLALEAQATDVTIDALAATVLAKAAEWLQIGAKVEAARMAAKREISLATTVGAIAASATIDWNAAVNGA